MSGPVSPPLATTESGTTVRVQPTNTLEFNGADFTVTQSGSKASIAIDSTGAGAALTATQVGFGDSSNLLSGDSTFTFDSTNKTLSLASSVSGATYTALELSNESNDAGGNVLFRMISKAGTDSDFEIEHDSFGGTTFRTNQPNTGTNRALVMSLSGFNVNPDQQDMDFQVESTGNINLIRTDGANDNVGIGSTPDSDTLLHIKGSGSKAATVRVESTDTDAGVGPVFELLRNPSEAVQVNDDLGKIEYQGPGGDVSGTPKAYAQIITEAQGASSGSEHARVMFKGLVSGTMKEFIRYSAIGIEVNAFGQDIDFKVEGDNDPNLISTDASDDSVGIGSAPDTNTAKLQVTDDGSKSFTLLLESTDDDANQGPVLGLWRNSPSPASGDDIGAIVFSGENASGTRLTYGRIRADMDDVTAGSEDCSINFQLEKAGSLRNQFRIRHSEVVVNEDSVDTNFRVESDGNTNMFMVDAGLNLVSVGASPVSGGATFQVPDNTISHYCNVNTIRSDAAGVMTMVNEDCQGQMWVHDSVSAHEIDLPEGGVKGMHFQFMSTDGNITIDPLGSDTLNGGTASLTRSTNFEIYDVFCYANGKWALSNPA